ncbi:MAG TPA: sigma-54 dependent transcriptional regulator [Polyangiaceae bacterium]
MVGRDHESGRANILLVDDDESMCDFLSAHLVARGYVPTTECEPQRVLGVLESRPIDVVVSDLQMQGMSGLELCERVVAAHPQLPVVLLTGHATLETAVAALRLRAYDFLSKPADVDALVAVIDRAVRHRRLEREGPLPSEIEVTPPFEGIIGSSAPMRELVQLLGRVGAVDASVVLYGESGTGKELAARALHERSARRGRPFVALNCAAIPGNLLESELFGHVKGAFTDARSDRPGLFERAKGGTVFLDEITELHPTMQPKLLRALQERSVRPVGSDREVPIDVRVVAATNTEMSRAVEAGRFRADLYYRLNVIEIRMPPLRERRSDVPLLAAHLVERFARKMGRRVVGVSAPCMAKLTAYDWPGNVRELANAVERAVALTRSQNIEVDDLPENVRSHTPQRPLPTFEPTEELLPLEEVERRYIRRVMAATGGNKTLAAQILGVHRRTLYRKDWKSDGDRRVS